MGKKSHYEMEINNRSKSTFIGVRVEYRIYRSLQKDGDDCILSDFRTMPLALIPPDAEIRLDLGETISCQNDYDKTAEKVLGVRARVILRVKNEEVVREICFPETLNEVLCPWREEEPLRILNSLDKEPMFLDPESLRITADTADKEWISVPSIASDRMDKTASILFQLENNASVSFNDLRVEYCLYLDTETRGDDYRYIYPYTTQLGSIDSGAENKFVLKGPLCVKIESNGFYSDVFAGQFRVYLPLEDGREVMREVFFPKPLPHDEYPWELVLREDESPHRVPLK